MFKKLGFFIFLVGMSGMASAIVIINTTRTTVTTNAEDPSAPLFAGIAVGCTQPDVPGAPNCCSTTGWDSNPALRFCTAAEHDLATALRESRAVSIGTTCLQENGSCKSALAVYCVYPDQVTYLVQKEGKQQLGLSFGTPANPSCGGFTQQQVEGIDLTRIDFTSVASPFVVLQATQS